MKKAKINIGICQWSLPVEGPCSLELAAELGFPGVELEIRNPERGFPLSKPVIQSLYLSRIKKYKLAVPSLAVNELDFYCLTGPESSEETHIAFLALEKAIHTAKAMNIPKIQVPCFNRSELSSENLGRAAEIFRDVCDSASKHGITVSTENALVPDEMQKLIEEVNRPNFKLYFDTQNYYLKKGLNTADVLQQLFPYICEIHVKDGKNGDLSGALLGEGDSGFHETIDVIKKNNYSGWLFFENYYDQEPLSLQNENPLELIKQDYSILKKALGK